MAERKWKSVHFEVRILSMLLSFSCLAIVWIVLGAVKFHLYGIDGWGYHWRMAPTTWDNAKAFWDLHLYPAAFCMVLGCAADLFWWPYFLKKENSFKFIYED